MAGTHLPCLLHRRHRLPSLVFSACDSGQILISGKFRLKDVDIVLLRPGSPYRRQRGRAFVKDGGDERPTLSCFFSGASYSPLPDPLWKGLAYPHSGALTLGSFKDGCEVP